MGHPVPGSSPAAQFSFDLNQSPFFKLDDCNFINIMGARQLNTLENVSLLDIFMSAGHLIEPHYHQNAAELIYCISGAVTVSILNPFTKQVLDYPLTPGQAANVPKGWWHYELATADGTHLLAIFDAPNPEVILGSDILTLTPPRIFAQTYGIDESAWMKAIAPVHPSTFIGPRSPVQCQMPMHPLSRQPWPQTHPAYPVPSWPGTQGGF